MGKQERRAYLEAIRTRYRRAGKAGKIAILDEFCAVCGYHRKYTLRLLGAQHKRSKQVVLVLDLRYNKRGHPPELLAGLIAGENSKESYSS